MYLFFNLEADNTKKYIRPTILRNIFQYIPTYHTTTLQPGAKTSGCFNRDVIDEDTISVRSTLVLEPNFHVAYTRRQLDVNDLWILFIAW